MIVIDCEKPKCCGECFALTYMGTGNDSYEDEYFACSFNINRKMPYGYFDTKTADDCPIKKANNNYANNTSPNIEPVNEQKGEEL